MKTTFLRKITAMLLLGLVFTPAAPTLAHAREIAIIVSKANPSSQLTESLVRDMYMGNELFWPHGGRVKLVNNTVSSEIRKEFYRIILHSPPEATFNIPRTPLKVQSLIQRSSRGALQFVANIKEAIGYVWVSEVDDSVKVVLVIE